MRTIIMSAFISTLSFAHPASSQSGPLCSGLSATVSERPIHTSVPDTLAPGLYAVDHEGVLEHLASVESAVAETEPLYSGKRRTVLHIPGASSGRRFTTVPVIYLRTDSTTPLPVQEIGSHLDTTNTSLPMDLKLVRWCVRKGRRELETMVWNCYIRRNGVAPENLVSFTTQRIAPGLHQLTVAPLQEGEYAVLHEQCDPRGRPRATVFEFGIGNDCGPDANQLEQATNECENHNRTQP